MNFERIANSRITTLVLVALVTVFGIHVVSRGAEDLRLDLTQDNLYSLSDGTVEILEQMQQEGIQPVEMKLYFSETTGKTLPRFIKDFITYERYLRALLEEYELASKGKVRVSFIDPLPDSDDAQDATDYGLDGKPINQHGDLFFFGLVIQTQTGSKDVIEFLWPNQQETVEYEISKTLSTLLWPSKKRIGVLSSLEVVSEASNPYMAQILAAQGKNPGETWVALQLLEETYEVEKIDADTDEIPRDSVDLLVVIHPKNLNDRALWAIDEWVARGGNTLLFLDPYTLTDQPPQNPQQPWAAYQYDASSNLERLMTRWGLERVPDVVAADFDLAVKRPASRLGASERMLVDLLIDDSVRNETLASDHPIFQGLTDLRFFLAGSLAKTGEDTPEGVELTPLVTTTSKGNTLTVKPGFPGDEDLVFLDLNNPAKIQDRFEPGDEPVVLAWQVQGQLPLLFPDGASIPGPTPPPPPGLPPGIDLPPQVSDEVVSKAAVPAEERAEATVMVFADVDLISDAVAFQSTPFGVIASNDNHKVLLNAVDFLFGSSSLMKVRARQRIERPFTLFDEIEQQADEQTLERERELREEIALFEDELRQKETSANSNEALFQKQLQDEIDELNDRISEANRELREIRKEKRAALENEEAKVWWTTLGLTPSLVLILGATLFVRRRNRDNQARRNNR